MNAKITILDTAASTRRRAMILRPEGVKLQLTRTSGVNVIGALGWTVRVLHGIVWVTRDGDIRDIVLETGQEYIFDSAGSVMLWTLGDGDAHLAIGLREKAARHPSAVPATRPALA